MKVLLAASLLLLLPGCLQNALEEDVAEPLTSPPWRTAGDYVRYRVTDANTDESWVDEQRVAALEAKDVGGVSYQTYRIEYQDNSEDGVNGTTWFRVADEALVADEDAAGLVTQAIPPCRFYEWPLAVGRTWSRTCTLKSTLEGETITFDISLSVRVERREQVTVPAGRFDTFVVRTSSLTESRELDYQLTAITTEWIAPAACGAVVKAIYQDSDDEESTTELLEHRCKKGV